MNPPRTGTRWSAATAHADVVRRRGASRAAPTVDAGRVDDLGGAARSAAVSAATPEAPETRSSALEAARSEPYRLATAPPSSVRAITMRWTSLVPSPISPSFASRM